MERVPVERIEPVPNLRPAVSGTGRKVPDLHQRRRTTALEQERQGDLLCLVGRQDHGGASEVNARWAVAGNRNSGGPVSRSHRRRSAAWRGRSAIRRVFRWPAIPGQSRRGRRRGLAHNADLELETQTLASSSLIVLAQSSSGAHRTVRDGDNGWAPNFRSKAIVLSRTLLALSPPRGASPAASASGVYPPRSFAFRLAPFSTRNGISRSAPVQAAPCKAVLPLAFAALISFPSIRASLAASRSLASSCSFSRSSMRPTPAAIIRAVAPSLALIFGSAPASNSVRMSSTSAAAAASRKGVTPTRLVCRA